MSESKKTTLSKEDSRVLEKLKEMMEKKGISQEDLEKDCFFSHSKVKSYLTGQRRITEQAVREISEFYNINFNWFYDKTKFMDDIDIQVHNLSLLHKVFRMKVVPNRCAYYDTSYDISSIALCFDKRYIRYIFEIYQLERERNNPKSVFSDEDFDKKRKEIFSKHEKYLRQIFELDDFVEAKALICESADDISFVNILTTIYEGEQDNY